MSLIIIKNINIEVSDDRYRAEITDGSDVTVWDSELPNKVLLSGSLEEVERVYNVLGTLIKEIKSTKLTKEE